jgi:hypothetical protein
MPVRQRYSSEFRRVYSTGALGGFDGYDFTLTFFRDNVRHPEEPDEAPSIEREFIAEVVLSAAALKEVVQWLRRNVDEIEQKHGPVRDASVVLEAGQREIRRTANRTLAAYS